uniref:hypothetical protein n=1 Tax=Salmonella enterica TaxID=28901 RepID=UPI001C439334
LTRRIIHKKQTGKKENPKATPFARKGEGEGGGPNEEERAAHDHTAGLVDSPAFLGEQLSPKNY